MHSIIFLATMAMVNFSYAWQNNFSYAWEDHGVDNGLKWFLWGHNEAWPRLIPNSCHLEKIEKINWWTTNWWTTNRWTTNRWTCKNECAHRNPNKKEFFSVQTDILGKDDLDLQLRTYAPFCSFDVNVINVTAVCTYETPFNIKSHGEEYQNHRFNRYTGYYVDDFDVEVLVHPVTETSVYTRHLDTKTTELATKTTEHTDYFTTTIKLYEESESITTGSFCSQVPRPIMDNSHEPNFGNCVIG